MGMAEGREQLPLAPEALSERVGKQPGLITLIAARCAKSPVIRSPR
jgi:hypothetical protein